MSIALDIFCFVVPLMMLFSAIISEATGVGGPGWRISARSVLMDVAFWQFSNNPPNYASVDDAMTFIIMLHSTCTVLFYGGIACISVLYFGPRENYPPALLRASVSDM